MKHFDADKVQAERRAQQSRRAALQKQIRNDQENNAKRDEEAIERERAWQRENGG